MTSLDKNPGPGSEPEDRVPTVPVTEPEDDVAPGGDARPGGAARRRAPWRRLPLALGLVLLAGLVCGLAAGFHYWGWSSVPGNQCDEDTCPKGTTPTLLLAFLCTFAGVALVAVATARLGRAPLPLVGVLVGCLAVGGGVWSAHQVFLWLRGPVLVAGWQADRDTPSTLTGSGVWTADGGAAVIRVRTDALVSYGARDGKVRWSAALPARMSVCAVSDTTSGGIGVVAYGREGGACAGVRAVDLRTGRTLWQHAVAGALTPGGATDGWITTGDGLAVTVADGAVHAYGLRDGRERWTATTDAVLGRVAGGDAGAAGDLACNPWAVSVSGSGTRIAVECDRGGEFDTAYLATVDDTAGHRTDARELPVESRLKTLSVLASSPLTLLVEEDDTRGTHGILVYRTSSSTGVPLGEPVAVPLHGADEDLFVAPTSFGSRPQFRAVVTGGRLVVAAGASGDEEADRVSAYALDDGHRLWSRRFDDRMSVRTLAPAGGGRVTVLGDSLLSGGRLWTLDTIDGSPRGDSDGWTTPSTSDLLGYADPQLVRTTNGWVLAGEEGGSYPPLVQLR